MPGGEGRDTGDGAGQYVGTAVGCTGGGAVVKLPGEMVGVGELHATAGPAAAMMATAADAPRSQVRPIMTHAP
jgi:hypothetical protein